MFSGWTNRQQLQLIEYLQAEHWMAIDDQVDPILVLRAISEGYLVELWKSRRWGSRLIHGSPLLRERFNGVIDRAS